MEDIEDIWKNSNQEKREVKSIVKIKTTHKKCCGKKANCCKNKNVTEKNTNKESNEIDLSENIIASKYLTGVQSVFVKTYGCSHNTSDSEFMMGLLSEYGYKLVDSFENCDLCVINSCTVKNPSQDAFLNYIKKAKNDGKKIVVSGCVPQGDRNIPGLEDCSVVGVTQIDRIVEVVEETLKGNIVRLLAKKELPSLDLPKIRRNNLIEIISINTGCLGSCTYCKTKHARGKLGSYEIDAIVKSAVKASAEGVKEIWLTSEDTGAYGRDINTDLPTLMMEILKSIPSDVMLRLGMTNPPYIMEHLEKMALILNHPNCYAFLHIPVQSGSNPVLDKMNREYKIEEFNLVCGNVNNLDYLKEHVTNITLATDIICGFPTETKENFDETLALIEKYKFPVINISQFYPRPGTVAAKWKRVDTKEVKRRSTAVAGLFASYQNYQHLKDTIQRVWIHDLRDEGRNNDENQMVAHTKAYVKVLLKRQNELIGMQAIVKIKEIHKWHVYGEIIEAPAKHIKVNFEDHFKGVYQNTKKSSNIEKNDKQSNNYDIHKFFLTQTLFEKMKFENEVIKNSKPNNFFTLLACLCLLITHILLIIAFKDLVMK